MHTAIQRISKNKISNRINKTKKGRFLIFASKDEKTCSFLITIHNVAFLAIEKTVFCFTTR